MLSIEPDMVLAGRFAVLEKLEADKSSSVLLVRDLQAEDHPERFLKLKQINNSKSVGRSHSLLDIETLRSFRHPSLLRVYDGGLLNKSKEIQYLVTDKVPGVPILEWIDKSDRSLKEWVGVICQVLEGLSYLHENGWIHLLVSDSTIRVHEGRALIVHHGTLSHEFELSEARSDQTTAYSAPEMVGGCPLDRRADFYAIGVLLYRIVAGSFPFSEVMSDQPLALHTMFRLSIPHSPLATIFSPLLQNLLAREPGLRKRSAGQIIESLKVLTGEHVDSQSPKITVLVPQFIGRRRELSSLNSAVSFLVDEAQSSVSEEGLVVARRSTRMIVRTPEALPSSSDSWISVHGERGLGKTRLVGEFARKLLSKGVEFIWLSGQALQRAVFDPITEIIQRLLARPGALKRAQEAPESVRRELLRFAPNLVTKIPPPTSRAEDDDEFSTLHDMKGERDRIIDGLASFIIQEARTRPLILVVTDFEALSELSQDLVAHLARRVATSRRWHQRFAGRSTPFNAKGPIPFFILTTSVAAAAGNGDAIEDGRQVINLSALKRWEISRLICDALGLDRVHKETIEWLYMVVAGHPGRLLERLRTYQDLLEDIAGTWQLKPEVYEDISAFVSDLTDSKRLKEMDLEGRTLLAVFGCLERPLSAEMLLASLGCDGARAISSLQELLRLRLIIRRSDQRLTLITKSLGEKARLSFAEEEREELDKQVMQALVDQYERRGREEQLIELAEFAMRIGDAHRMLEFAADAADSYERIRADDRALELYQALLSTGKLLNEEALALRVRMAACLFRNKQTEEAIKELRLLVSETPTLWPPAPRAIICRRLAMILVHEGRDSEALNAFQSGEHLVESLEKPDIETVREYAALLAAKADFLLDRAHEVDKISKTCERAQRALREHGATGKGRDFALVRARLLAMQGRIEFINNRYDSAEQLTRAALAVQERYGAILQSARSYYRLGNIELSRDREGSAEKHWHKSLNIRRQFGDRYGVSHILANLSLTAARVGRMEKARDFILQSLRIREESGDIHGRAASLHNLGYIYASAGNIQSAVASYNECLALREELNDIHYAAQVQNNLAQCLFVLGETMEARERLVAALSTLQEEGDRRGEAAALARLAEIDFHRGSFEKAVQKAASAQKIREEIGSTEDLIESLQVNSTIELGLGRHNKATSQIHKACEMARGGGYQVQLARSLLLHGRILSHLRDYDSAKSVLLEAQHLYERIGDQRALRCTSMEIATVYLGVGLHSDADLLINPALLKLEGSGGTQLELGYGYEKIRELHITSLLQLINRNGQPELAKSSALEAYELCQQSKLISQSWRSLRLASAAAEALGDPTGAQDLALEAQEIVEELATHVPEERRSEYLAKAAVKAAIRGDPSLESLKRRYLRRKPEISAAPDQSAKTLGVTITPPAVPRSTRPQPPRTKPSTVHIKRLRTRSKTTSVVTKGQAPSNAEANSRSVELATIIRLNRKILSRGSRKKSLGSCLTAAVKLCRAERGFLAIAGGDGLLNIVCAENMNREDVRLAKNAFSLRMAQRALATGRMIVSSDAAHDRLLRRHSSLLGIGVRSVLAVPVSSSQLSGVIYLDHRFQRGVFSLHLQNLAQGFADQVGLICELSNSAESSSEIVKLPRSKLTADLPPERFYRVDPFTGSSEFMEELYNQSPEWASSDESILIAGETSTGKQTLARTLHHLGPRSREPLVILDCRTVPDELVEVELFGQLAGAYEGALARKGLLRTAGKGTLIIEGLWHASELVRTRVAAALRSRLIRPLGSDASEAFEARIVTLAPSAGLHRLRSGIPKSLFSLLSEIVISLPALRERPQDIPFVLEEMLLEMSAEAGVPLTSLEKEALEIFVGHSWFGNYRELKSALRTAWKSAGGSEVIRVADLPILEDFEESSEDNIAAVKKVDSLNMNEAIKRTQHEIILKALDVAEDRDEAAKLLGIQRRKLNKLMKKLDITL
jgi:DNA-binding NtrC family response regulator/serine/threonine protein kinase/tetratricopeptide (TPR) repeat protein